MNLTQRIRAVASARLATPVPPPPTPLVLEVGDSFPHGQHARRTVARWLERGSVADLTPERRESL